MILWITAFHVISMVAWFAGLFYLPRLFVYHAASSDAVGIERFKIMERKLYWYIMTPAAIATTVFGLWLFSLNWQAYLSQGWMHGKFLLAGLLWIYQIYCGVLVKKFAADQNPFSQKFYRFFNEIPTLLLIGIVILVIVKPGV